MKKDRNLAPRPGLPECLHLEGVGEDGRCVVCGEAIGNVGAEAAEAAEAAEQEQQTDEEIADAEARPVTEHAAAGDALGPATPDGSEQVEPAVPHGPDHRARMALPEPAPAAAPGAGLRDDRRAEGAVEAGVAESLASATELEKVEEEDDLASNQIAALPIFSFLCGTAGTGKSFQARLLADSGEAILTATTGIAAVNLGGTTINSIFHYKDTGDLQTQYEFGRVNAILRKMSDSGYRLLIVDEVSMMDGQQLTILTTAIEEFNDKQAEQGKPPMKLMLVGDFAQLPPVKASFAFASPLWDRFESHTTMLTEPRRQADPEFVRALQAARRGDAAAATEYFSQFIVPSEDRHFDGTTILAKNDEVDRYNKIRMLEIHKPEDLYITERHGEEDRAAWKNIPDALALKEGCLVMVLANRRENPDDTQLLYANGDLGHYLGPHDPGGVGLAKSPKLPARVRLLRNNREVIVGRVVREKKSPTGNKGKKLDAQGNEVAPRDEKLGWIDYMPLRVAYATTCHRSQGLSLDKVQIMINSMFWATPGMLYVALSRARTPQGLRVVGTAQQFHARVKANAQVRRWL